MKTRMFLHISSLCIVLFMVMAPAIYAKEPSEVNKVLGNDPVYIVQTLMNNNYMSIKQLYVPIINYGGGQKEFYRLLDSYSHALTLYLHRRMTESADMFRKNEAEIKVLAEKLAKKYHADTKKLHAETVKMYIRSKINNSMEARNVETEIPLYTTGDTYINNASDSIRMADRYLETGRPIDAIYYYRKSKAYCFEAFDNYRVPLPDGFQVDLADNRNLVFVGVEKGKTCVNC